MLIKSFFFVLIIVSSCVTPMHAQQKHDAVDSSLIISARLFNQLDKKFTRLRKNIESKSLKSLKQLQKQETRLYRKLRAKDSTAALQLFIAGDDYKNLESQIKNPLIPHAMKEYFPGFDSLKTSLQFLSQAYAPSAKLKIEWVDKMENTKTNLQLFESGLQQANNIKQFTKYRRQQLQEQLSKYGFGKELKKLNKEVYYYHQQLNEYKSLLKDRKKLEQKAIAELRKLPAFTEFFKNHSQLASLFRLPDNYGTAQSLTGLQTRASVQSQIQQRFSGSGVIPQQYIGQQVQQAQDELNKLKDKLNTIGGRSSDMEMPDFKANPEKTKNFFKRIETGANIQSQNTSGLLPVTSDIALTAGYKFTGELIMGAGIAYKLGWGRGWQHIKLTHEGFGFRSFIDYKMKGSFWLSGAYEQNYLSAFRNIQELRVFNAWQKTSGLIGITKKYKIAKRTNNVQVLWDFLSFRQQPRSAAVVFRVGYLF